MTHILGMASACINPLLYAVLNDNFRKEFVCLWLAVRTGVSGIDLRGMPSKLFTHARRRVRFSGATTSTHVICAHALRKEHSLRRLTLMQAHPITQLFDRQRRLSERAHD